MRYLLLIPFVLTLAACGGLKPGMSGKAQRYYTTFYTGAGTQYFIKPLAFATADGHTLLLDATFRDGDLATDSATVNFTVTTPSLPDSVPELSFLTRRGPIGVSRGGERLFREREKAGFTGRYSVRVPISELLTALGDEALRIGLRAGAERTVFEPEGKANRSLGGIRDRLLPVLRSTSGT